ncbi:transaldolase [Verticillium dahliae VdLs.17]|uniref:Transaldolase n=1 Tax=Verticillium dahliae (strain VdLs.17 / ATCC MYA-4575 / FGSC 10137) TaxID=498257 RepID=G2X2K3_VERDV|nr:transaldolase [Verticillium dahliae VdLs.17]EGY23089.1 transaldolase [Verticillium dahliae VdLs.17]KAF3360246.1 Methylcrotonoyl-CoA carboxylase subunit alpha [Verticillium dahliae VDG1]
MGSAGTPTWLDKLEEQLNVDVDWMDPEYIKGMPIVPHDQTSNQLWVDIQLGDDSNRELLLETAKELKNDGWLAIYTRMAVLMCKKNINSIRGRVLLQTLPSNAFRFQETLDHARLYDKEFARAGIGRDRYCIKIPSTGPALNAAKVLSSEGIPTLGTALFSLPQAIACSQAGMLYISPYYNGKLKIWDTKTPVFEVLAHDEPELWPNVKDPAVEHPIFITVQEAMAAGEMGCHSATISHTVLNELAKLRYVASEQPGPDVPKPAHVYKDAPPVSDRLRKLLSIDPLAGPDWDGKLASTDVDYLADGGASLQNAIEADAVTKKRLADAMALFTGGQERSRAKIEEVLPLV